MSRVELKRSTLLMDDTSPSHTTNPHTHTNAHNAAKYNEEDHRRLVFGLMRSGLTPQVELALRLIDSAEGDEDEEDDGSDEGSDEYETDGSEDYEGSERSEEDEEDDGPVVAVNRLSLNDNTHTSQSNSSSSNNNRNAPRGGQHVRSPDTKGGLGGGGQTRGGQISLRAGMGREDYDYNANSTGGGGYVKTWLADIDRSQVFV